MQRALVLTAFVAFGMTVRGGEEPTAKPQLVIETGAHRAEVMKMLFTPDSKQLITVSLDKTIRVWDVSRSSPKGDLSGKLLRVIRTPIGPGSDGELHAAALSADGRILAVGGKTVGSDSKKALPLFLIDPAKGTIIRSLRGTLSETSALAISGKVLASGTFNGRIYLWDLETGKAITNWDAQKSPNSRTAALAFSPDGKRIASVGLDGPGHVWSVPDGKKLFDLKIENLRLRESVAWSPDGKYIVAGVGQEYNPQNKFFAVWNAADGTVYRKIYNHNARPMNIDSLAFTPDSSAILASSFDEWMSHTVTWELKGKEPRKIYLDKNQFDTDNVPRSPSLMSPDGRLVAIANDRHKRIHIYSAGGKFLRRLGGEGQEITDVAWAKGKSPEIVWRTELVPKQVPAKEITPKYFQQAFRLEGMQLVPVGPGPFRREWFSTKEAKLKWNGRDVKVEAGGKTVPLKLPNIADTTFSTMSLVGSDHAVVGTWNGLFHMYDTKTGKQMYRLRGPNGVTRTSSPSPDGRYVLAGGDDQVLRIWDTKSPTPLLSLYVAGRDWIAWTAEGYYAATPGGERLVGWQINNGTEEVATFLPVERFRKQFYRPDVIQAVLQQGTVKEAVKVANAALPKETKVVRSAQTVKVEDLLPPKATLTIVDKSALPTLKVKIEAKAGSKSQPIQGLRLLIDGRPLPDGQGVLEFKNAKSTVSDTWTIKLPGEKDSAPYKLVLLARSADSSGISNAVEVKHAGAKKLPSMHVLNIGINDYQDASLRLQFASPDARALADAFGKSGKKGGMFAQVTPTLLVDKDATRERILGALVDIRKKVKPNDLVVVSFACHGVKSKEGFYLLTSEAKLDDLEKTTLNGDLLRQKLADFPCQVLLLLDACHSAGFGEGRKLSKAGLRPATDDASRAMTDDEVGVAVLCAAMGHEKAEEKDGNGLFTKAIVQALGNSPGVPFNIDDHRLYIHHLHSYVFDAVKSRSSGRQHPFLSLPWIVESFPVAQFSASRN